MTCGSLLSPRFLRLLKGLFRQKWPRQNIVYHGSIARSNASLENETSCTFVPADQAAGCPDIKNHYKRFRAHVQKAIRDAYWKHISNIFTLDTETIDPDSPRKNEKAKKFWSFVKSLKKDAFGITSLCENEILKTDTVDKEYICSKQFQSAFTRETDSEIPSKGTSPFTATMGEILKLLNRLKVHSFFPRTIPLWNSLPFFQWSHLGPRKNLRLLFKPRGPEIHVLGCLCLASCK